MELLPERNCVKCTPGQKVSWGCDGKATVPLYIDDELQETCPRRPILDDPESLVDLLELFENYDRGHLPEDGGVQSQPYVAMQYFRWVLRAQTYISRHHENKRIRAQESQARMSRGPIKRGR